MEQKNICDEKRLPFPQPFKWDTHIKVLQGCPGNQKVYSYLAKVGMSPAQFQKCIDFKRRCSRWAYEPFIITQDLKEQDSLKLRESFVGDLASYMDSIRRAIDVASIAITLTIE